MIAAVLAVLALPPVLDALVRGVLACLARGWRFVPAVAGGPLRWVVLVPSRGEGTEIVPTVAALRAAAEGFPVDVVVVLDGRDDPAEAACRRLGVAAVVKEPAGPTKASALAWAASELGDRLAAVDAVLLVDVGSIVDPAFFSRFAWPPGAAAVQAFLAGHGEGVGAAAAASERSAQRWEDPGRERLGWGVRLRGTGTAMRPDAFAAVAPLMRTRIEDLEASIVLLSRGLSLRMGPPDALVADDKPASPADIARQRARWLAGRWTLPFRQPGAIARLLLRSPLEGGAFILELCGRPLSLSSLVRLAAAVAAAAQAAATGNPWWAMWAAITLASVVLDGALIWLSGGLTWRNAAGLVAAWFGAVAMVPRAAAGWLRVRRR